MKTTITLTYTDPTTGDAITATGSDIDALLSRVTRREIAPLHIISFGAEIPTTNNRQGHADHWTQTPRPAALTH